MQILNDGPANGGGGGGGDSVFISSRRATLPLTPGGFATLTFTPRVGGNNRTGGDSPSSAMSASTTMLNSNQGRNVNRGGAKRSQWMDKYYGMDTSQLRGGGGPSPNRKESKARENQSSEQQHQQPRGGGGPASSLASGARSVHEHAIEKLLIQENTRRARVVEQYAALTGGLFTNFQNETKKLLEELAMY